MMIVRRDCVPAITSTLRCSESSSSLQLSLSGLADLAGACFSAATYPPSDDIAQLAWAGSELDTEDFFVYMYM